MLLCAGTSSGLSGELVSFTAGPETLVDEEVKSRLFVIADASRRGSFCASTDKSPSEIFLCFAVSKAVACWRIDDSDTSLFGFDLDFDDLRVADELVDSKRSLFSLSVTLVFFGVAVVLAEVVFLILPVVLKERFIEVCLIDTASGSVVDTSLFAFLGLPRFLTATSVAMLAFLDTEV